MATAAEKAAAKKRMAAQKKRRQAVTKKKTAKAKRAKGEASIKKRAQDRREGIFSRPVDIFGGEGSPAGGLKKRRPKTSREY